jgi:DNA-directed DNA polymerase III PolC
MHQTETITMPDFTHLHVHTEYSLLDGLSKIPRLVSRAQELGMTSLAITDHGTMFGVIDFYRACKAAAIKPIIGVESYLAKRTRFDRDREDRKSYHLLLLAQNQTGYQNLLRIASEAQLNGFYYAPRIDREFLAAHAEGLIATSGCLAAQIPSLVMEGRDDEARELIGWYQDVFGRDNFYLELQQHDIAELDTVNQWLIDNCAYANVPLVATNDVHYVLEADYDPHDTLLCIQTTELKSTARDQRMAMSDPSYHLASQQEMWKYFGHIRDGEALKNTLRIAEMCELDLDSKGYHLPVFPVPPGHTADTYLRYLAEKGMGWRYGDRWQADPVLTERLNRELGIIHDMGFDTYFLIVWDLCQYARHADIWWNVRGSGAGSVVAYALGITSIDPIINNLLFERFLNPGRVSMPDIDLDYPDDRRGEMIEYTARKYGEDRVAAIITFGTMGAKAAVRDVGRALDVPLTLVNQAAKLIPTEPKPKPLMTYVEGNPELLRLYREDPDIKRVIDTARDLQGIIRHASTHAAGVIVGDRPLVEYIPLHRPTKGEKDDDEGSALKAVTQFPMETCESIGLLKIDFLGLSTLTIMRRACDLIEQHHGVRYTMENIPYRHDYLEDDPEWQRALDAAFALIGRGDTVGVFQVESSGMQQMLREMRPTRFEHIVAAISLYRPGPMDYIPMFNRRMHGEEEITYLHPKLEPILKETFSIITYQEQIMQIASELFGYELGEADLMRRAVSKKKEKDLLTHKAIFLERGPQNGVDTETAERIFADIEFFANYGFNKCVTADTEIVDAETGRMVRVGDLAAGRAQVAQTITCDTDTLRLKNGSITAVMHNGMKPVYRLTTQTGRTVTATANHPFYTFDRWRMLGDLQPGDHVAVPRRIPVEGRKSWNRKQIEAFAQTFTEFDEIPNELFELDNDSLKRLFAYLFNDAFFTPGDLSFLTIMVGKERLVRQLQHLLLRIGIISNLKNSHIKAASLEKSGWRCDLFIAGAEGLGIFVEKLETYLNEEFRQKIVRRLPVPAGHTLGEAGGPDDDNNDIYWDRITSIEYIGEQPTYDLTIDETHNFIANDIIVHNSHAADYAVITVQTAFLKAHYPAEYMTALLTVHRDDSGKVAVFMEECRRLGIPILPPDVNYSLLDFDIQQQPDGSRGIRFGLAAVKNTGAASLQPIIEARGQGGIFATLQDFCQRVDLRAVGRRTLEQLIKVGAMQAFGGRTQLLAALDRLVSYSASYHKDKEIGQMSMFGADSSMAQDMLENLPDVAEVSEREMLGWEKELLGLYVTGRPVNKFSAQLRHANTAVITALKEADAALSGKAVVVAGEVVTLRKIVTKNGDMMGVAHLEDWHESAGTIDVVIFPRTWQKCYEIVQEGEILRVAGKFDTSRGDPQIIAETVDQNFSIVTPDTDLHSPPPPLAWALDDDEPFDQPPPDYELPPPPDDYFAPVADEPPQANGTSQPEPQTAAFPPAYNRDHPLLVSIHLHRTGDSERDARRLRRISNTLMNYPGQDRFVIIIRSPGKSVEMAFRDRTTGVCDDLLRQLAQIVGENNVRVIEQQPG